MNDQVKKLRKVEYSRSYTASNDQEIHLLGSSRWIRDLELLLETKWTNLKCFFDAAEASNALVEFRPKVVLVEPNTFGEDTSRWIEACVQNDLQALLIAPEGINQLEWIRSSRKAAAHNFGSSLFSSDARAASEEINDFLKTSDVLTSTKHLTDVTLIHFAQLGFGLNGAKSNELSRELFSAIVDEFIIPSDDIAKGLTLVNNTHLWKMPKAVESDLHRAFVRIERDIQDKDISRIVSLTLATITDFQNNTFSEESWKSTIQACGFAMLSRRKLATKHNEIANMIHSISNLRTLKIA